MAITLSGDGISSDAIASLAASKLTGVIPDANAPSGSVIQVVYGSTSTQVNTTSTSGVDTGLTASITPTSTSNKILVMISQHIYISGDNGAGIQIFRGGTAIFNAGNYAVFAQTAGIMMGVAGINYLDSPASTSSLTYKTQIRSRDSGETVGVQRDDSNTSTIILMEIAA
jgi:hypothetical protein